MMEWSLVTGWLPAALTALGFLALACLALFPWRPSWWKLAAVIVAGAAVVVIAINLYVTRIWKPFPGTLPVSVLVWSWLGLCGVALAVARLTRRSRPILAVLAAIIAMVGIGATQVNRYYGQYPTLGAALGVTRPGLTDLSTVERAGSLLAAPADGFLSDVWAPGGPVAAHGIVARIHVPPEKSGFRARPGYVYLPPGYLERSPRPQLPVLVLLAGQPGNADSWLVSGQLTTMIDGFAAAHRGLAPVVVMVDNLGANFANPPCADSQRGNVETYLSVDVPAWIRGTLQVAQEREMWAIAGLSNGGTCALQMAVRAPGGYGRFIDISGEYEPLDGTKQETIDRIFGGDAAAYAEINPVEIMARSDFPGTAGHADAIHRAFEADLPLLEPLAERLHWHLDDSSLVHAIRTVLSASPSTLAWITAGLFGYGLLQLAESVGLWLLTRWGEYLTAVATSAFIPLEVHELTERVTWVRVLALLVNLAAVVFLVYRKRLFGVHGGRAAHEAERHHESLIQVVRLS